MQPSCPEVDGKDRMRGIWGGPHLQLPTCHCCRELRGDTKTLLVERHGPFMSEASGRTEQSVYKKRKKKWNIYSQEMSKWQNVCVCAARRSNVGNATGNWRGGRWSGVKRECEWDVGEKNTHTHTRDRESGAGKKKKSRLCLRTLTMWRWREAERLMYPSEGVGGGGEGCAFPGAAADVKKKTPKNHLLSYLTPPNGQHSNARTDGNKTENPLSLQPHFLLLAPAPQRRLCRSITHM